MGGVSGEAALCSSLPKARRALCAFWVFAKKPNPNDTTRYKARYIAKGFNQREGTNYAHTFALTANFTSMRILLTISAKNNWPVYNFNFVAAYLNVPINKEVWVQPPEGLNVPKGDACLLHKALYGTKQAARCWWKHLSSTLASMGYTSSYYDSRVYTIANQNNRSIIWVHVDNGIVTSSSDVALKKLEQQLSGTLKIKWNEGITSMVGVKIMRTTNGFELHQPNLIQKMLQENWDGKTVHKAPLPKGFNSNFIPGDKGVDTTKFLSVIGGLNYVSKTRYHLRGQLPGQVLI
jgi:hypothetical protein